MNISRDDLKEIIRRYMGAKTITETTIDDVSQAIWLVHDLIEAEVNATKEKEPYATRFIDRMTEAKLELVTIDCEITDMLDDMRMEGVSL